MPYNDRGGGADLLRSGGALRKDSYVDDRKDVLFAWRRHVKVGGPSRTQRLPVLLDVAHGHGVDGNLGVLLSASESVTNIVRS